MMLEGAKRTLLISRLQTVSDKICASKKKNHLTVNYANVAGNL